MGAMAMVHPDDPNEYSFQPAPDTLAAYRALAALLGHIYPDRVWSAAGLRAADGALRSRGFFERYEARVYGRLEGSGTLFRLPTDAPGTFHFGFVVRPGYEDSPLPAALQARLLRLLDDQRPVTVMTRVQETISYRIRLLTAQGFVPLQRVVSSELNVTAFDEAPFAGVADRLAEAGLAIMSVAEWAAEDATWAQRLWELLHVVEPEVSAPEQRLPTTKDQYNRSLAAPDTHLAAWGVVVDRRAANRPVGFSLAWPLLTRPAVLAAGLTGVHPAYRRQGIALALKLQTIAYARRGGYRLLRTENAAGNPLLALNVELGFQRAPALIDYVRPAPPDYHGER